MNNKLINSFNLNIQDSIKARRETVDYSNPMDQLAKRINKRIDEEKRAGETSADIIISLERYPQLTLKDLSDIYDVLIKKKYDVRKYLMDKICVFIVSWKEDTSSILNEV